MRKQIKRNWGKIIDKKQRETRERIERVDQRERQEREQKGETKEKQVRGWDIYIYITKIFIQELPIPANLKQTR